MSIKSKSSVLRGAKNPLFPNATTEPVSAPVTMETAHASASLATPTEEQRIEQMYLLADIFASIFEALPDEHQHAIASTREAA
jgi:hypothetical protein